MRSLDFPGATLKLGAGQTDIYQVIHAYPLNDDRGEVLAIYELSDEEMAKIIETKKIYYSRLTFNGASVCKHCNKLTPTGFQPMRLSVDPHEINVQFNDSYGNLMPEKHAATVDENGIHIPGYETVGLMEFKKITE